MSAAQIAVTLSGAAAIVWVLWYFLPARRRGAAPGVAPADTRRPPPSPASVA
ncbi:MAG: hypothetical protein ACREMV_05840 [Gemmatimonadales bacterium]